jgi:predicted ribosomally synthesized peptide with nif11-like leader
VETDEEFAAELTSLVGDPAAVFAHVQAAGFDVTEAEIRDAFLERCGAELTPEQLDAIAAGVDDTTAAMIGGHGPIVSGRFVEHP